MGGLLSRATAAGVGIPRPAFYSSLVSSVQQRRSDADTPALFRDGPSPRGQKGLECFVLPASGGWQTTISAPRRAFRKRGGISHVVVSRVKRSDGTLDSCALRPFAWHSLSICSGTTCLYCGNVRAAIGVRYLCGNPYRDIAVPVTETKTGGCRRQGLPKSHWGRSRTAAASLL